MMRPIEDFEECVESLSDPLLEIANTKRSFCTADGAKCKDKMMFWKLLSQRGVLNVLGYSNVEEGYELTEPLQLTHHARVIKMARSVRVFFYWTHLCLALALYLCAAYVYGRCFLIGGYCHTSVCYLGFTASLTAILGIALLCYTHCRLLLERSKTGAQIVEPPNFASLYIANVGVHVIFAVIFFSTLLVHKPEAVLRNNSETRAPQISEACVSPVFEFACLQISVFFLFTLFQFVRQTWRLAK